MSYCIIFETKIVKIPDGRIIHFFRQGCNNDDSGRKKDEFIAEGIYTVEEFIEYAESYKNSTCYGEGFDLKIGSKYATYKDYGEHLLRMLKRAKDYDEFLDEYIFYAEYVDYIELIRPEYKKYSPAEFSKIVNSLPTGSSYRLHHKYSHELCEVVNLIQNDESNSVMFRIEKRKLPRV